MTTLRRIFALAPDCHTAAGHYQSLWQRHFYDGLRAVAASLVTPRDVDFGWAREAGAWRRRGELASLRDAASQRLAEEIEHARSTHGLDAVVSYCFAHDVSPELVREVTRRGVPWINFFCDSMHCFEQVEGLARVVSLNWFVEHGAAARYRDLGARAVCLPYALNPEALPECGSQNAAGPVVFIGLPTANRITQLGWLRLMGCRVSVRGHGWTGAGDDPFRSTLSAGERLRRALRWRGAGEKFMRRAFWPVVRRQAEGPLTDAELPAFLRASFAVLGLNQGRDEQGRDFSYLKFRDLEFPGHGCCYVTQENQDVMAALEPGKEVMTYGSMAEASAVLRELRRTPERAAAIGRAGRQRVLFDHVWSRRIQDLAAAL